MPEGIWGNKFVFKYLKTSAKEYGILENYDF